MHWSTNGLAVMLQPPVVQMLQVVLAHAVTLDVYAVDPQKQATSGSTALL